MWGGVGFCLAAFGSGGLIDWLGVGVIFVICTLAMAATAITAFSIPGASRQQVDPAESPGHGVDSPATAGWAPLVAGWAFFAAVAMYGTAHASYDAGFTLYMTVLGASGTLLGAAWGIAQLSEIVAFAASGRLLRRFGAHGLLIVVFVVAAGRWGLLAVVSAPGLILLTQVLHAITFGLFQPAVIAEASSLGRGRGQNTAIGVVYACYGSGQVVGMWFVGVLLAEKPSTLFGAAIVITVGALLFLLLHGARSRR